MLCVLSAGCVAGFVFVGARSLGIKLEKGYEKLSQVMKRHLAATLIHVLVSVSLVLEY